MNCIRFTVMKLLKNKNNRIKYVISDFCYENKARLLIFLCSFIIALILGICMGVRRSSVIIINNRYNPVVNIFISNYSLGAYYFRCIMSSLFTFVIIAALCLWRKLIIGHYIFIFYKCFSFVYLCVGIIDCYNMSGILVVLIIFVPQQLILIASCVICSIFGYQYTKDCNYYFSWHNYCDLLFKFLVFWCIIVVYHILEIILISLLIRPIICIT